MCAVLNKLNEISLKKNPSELVYIVTSLQIHTTELSRQNMKTLKTKVAHASNPVFTQVLVKPTVSCLLQKNRELKKITKCFPH